MMTLSQKIGQLLIFGIPNPQLTSKEIEQLKSWHVGGVILFSRNLQNVSQSKKLISQLNESLSFPEHPLWLCVDQEGGVVVRLTEGVSVFPGNMALGATQDKTLAYQMGQTTAEEWGAFGVNVNFAPVLDLSYPENPGIGVRSLGQDKEAVAQLGVALIRGMQENGMCATAKHFPGKGLAKKDSHLELPYINLSKEALLETELYPFKEAIAAGVDFVMSSHCIYSAIDDKVPGTLSKPILTDLLRNNLGFKGLMVSDDLEMGAILKSLPIEEAALQFLQAGGDQVLVCHTPEAQEKVFQRLVQAVQNRELSENDLDEKLNRIQATKQKWLQQKEKQTPQTDVKMDSELSFEIAQKAITIVKNEEKALPLTVKPNEKVLALCVDYSPLTLVEENASNDIGLKQLLQPNCPDLTFEVVEVEPQKESLASILEKANKADLLLLFTYNAHMYPEQAKLVQNCLDLGKKSVVCALRNPYDFSVFPQVKHFVVSYGFREVSLKALVDVLFGKKIAEGKLPTDLIEEVISS